MNFEFCVDHGQIWFFYFSELSFLWSLVGILTELSFNLALTRALRFCGEIFGLEHVVMVFDSSLFAREVRFRLDLVRCCFVITIWSLFFSVLFISIYFLCTGRLLCNSILAIVRLPPPVSDL